MKKRFGIIFSLLSAFFIFVSCSPAAALSDISIQQTESVVNTHTVVQTEYLNATYDTVSNYADGTQELSFPQAVTLKWTAGEDERRDVKYTVEVSRTEDFSTPMAFTTYNTFIDVYNLYLDTQYFWRVSAEADGKTVKGKEVGSFKTAGAAPRNIFVDGITNVRDLGGWKTAEGKTVKQGLLYRSGRLNTSWYTDVNADITPYGIQTMRNTLGIKSEIDLRKDYQNEVSLMRESVLGKDINYYACAMEFDIYALGTNSIEGNKETLKEVFSLLADKDKYPMFFHCDIGTDRTGLIAYLVNGLLGVEEEQLYRDYLFSNFGRIGSSRSIDGIQASYVTLIKNYNGDTLSQKIENVLMDIVGVTRQQINSIRNILL